MSNSVLALNVWTQRTAALRGSLKAATADFEALAIRAALERHAGDITATTTELDLPRKTLYDKLAQHGIDPATYRVRR